MFSLRKWLMDGFRDAVGKMEDYQIILNATGWYEKNVLLEENLAELQELINKKNTPTADESTTEQIREKNDENFNPDLTL